MEKEEIINLIRSEWKKYEDLGTETLKEYEEAETNNKSITNQIFAQFLRYRHTARILNDLLWNITF